MAGKRHLGQLATRSFVNSRSSGTRHVRISQGLDEAGHRQEQIQNINRSYKDTKPTSQPRDIRPRNQNPVNMFRADMTATSQGKGYQSTVLAQNDASPGLYEYPISAQVLPFPDKLAARTPTVRDSRQSLKIPRPEQGHYLGKQAAEAVENVEKQKSIDLDTTMPETESSIIEDRVPPVISRKSLTDDPDPSVQSKRETNRSRPIICEDVAEIRALRRSVMQTGGTIGFVPTMGALHQGHLDLMKAAARKCSEVWVSIYVNPTQFGVNEDLSSYPSTWQADLEKIEELNESLLSSGQSRISTIFRPRTPEVLYPYGIEGTSHVLINPELTQILEGSSRPTFFRGVTTVVMKLLNIVQPEWTFFGQKDFQQFAVIKRMIKEFHLPVLLERVSTTRESTGLAMSSRNAYLGQRRHRVAPLLHSMLSAAYRAFHSASPGERTRSLLIESAMKVYTTEFDRQQRNVLNKPHRAVQFKLDYLSLADPDTLQEIRDRVGPSGAVMSLAIVFDALDEETIGNDEILGINEDQTTVRLIDNILLDEDSIDLAIQQDKKTREPS